MKFSAEFIQLSIVKYDLTASRKIMKSAAGFSTDTVDLRHGPGMMHIAWDLVCGATPIKRHDERHFSLK